MSASRNYFERALEESKRIIAESRQLLAETDHLVPKLSKKPHVTDRKSSARTTKR